MFSDAENDVLYLSLKSLDWTSDKYINRRVVIEPDQSRFHLARYAWR